MDDENNIVYNDERTSGSQTTGPALRRLLDTVELLEGILLWLPMTGILRAQRVSRSWQSCIKTSPALRHKLFLSPIPAAEKPPRQTCFKYVVQPVLVNPLLYNIFCIRDSEISGLSVYIRPAVGSGAGRNHQTNGPKRTHLNGITGLQLYYEQTQLYGSGQHDGPIFQNVLRPRLPMRSLADIVVDVNTFHRLIRQNREAVSSLTCHVNNGLGGCSTLEKVSGIQDSVKHYILESWAGMLLTQPPVDKLSVRDIRCKGERKAIRITAAGGGGITLGDLLRAVAEYYGRHDQSGGFRVNAELEIYQPLESLESRKGNTTSSVYEMRMALGDDEAVGALRAWEVRLKCNLG